MNDKTESIRRAMTEVINSEAMSKEELEEIYGQGDVFDTGELTQRFEVIGFMAPFCVVKDRATGLKGAITFQHSPRFYFGFRPENA